MSLPAETLRQFFYEYRHSSTEQKKEILDYLVQFDTTLEAQQRILRCALDYDILHPIADGKENVLRSSEISVVLFKRVWKYLPKDLDKSEFLSDILVNISLEARRILSERRCVAKTGEEYTKIITPFAIAYHVFLTLVFFDVSALSKEEFSRYSELLLMSQVLKADLRRAALNDTSIACKLHNTLTELEQIKLNFLKNHYDFSIEGLSKACQNVAISPPSLAIKEQEALMVSVQNNAERLQYQLMLELNKLAYGQMNSFGQLRFADPKPQAYSEEEFLDEDFFIEKKPEIPVASSSKSSFWQDKISKFGDFLSYSHSDVSTEAEWYYRFPPY